MRKRKINLLYVIGTFPVLSETFIQREILEMFRYKRLNIKIISFRKGDEHIPLPPEVKSKILFLGLTSFKFSMRIYQEDPKKIPKYFGHMCTPTVQNWRPKLQHYKQKYFIFR